MTRKVILVKCKTISRTDIIGKNISLFNVKNFIFTVVKMTCKVRFDI